MANLPLDIQIEIRNLQEVQRAMEAKAQQLSGTPMMNALRDCALMVEYDAKVNAPVNTGRLRASITPEVRVEGEIVMGVVGSNVEYAPYMELGTRPHFPPPEALERWVYLKGLATAEEAPHVAFLIARAIGKRGLEARRFLQGAVEKNENRMIDRIERAVEEIIKA